MIRPLCSLHFVPSVGLVIQTLVFNVLSGQLLLLHPKASSQFVLALLPLTNCLIRHHRVLLRSSVSFTVKLGLLISQHKRVSQPSSVFSVLTICTELPALIMSNVMKVIFNSLMCSGILNVYIQCPFILSISTHSKFSNWVKMQPYFF